MPSHIIYDSPIGKLYLEEEGGSVTKISFFKQESPTSSTPHQVLAAARQQLEEYFHGTRQKFDLPLAPKGTSFMLKVWGALQTIPYGKTASYQEIALKAGNVKACRAVGMANNHNPIAIVVPCHRVIGKNGMLVGYGGGLAQKQYLLELEQKFAAPQT